MEISYLFFACCGLAILALILYWFFPKLRKNSFQLELSEEEKQNLQDYSFRIFQLVTNKDGFSLEKRYATELANGQAILIKGTDNAEKKPFFRIILVIILLFIILYIDFENEFIFFSIKDYLPKCLFDDGGIVLLIIGYSFIFLQDGISNLKADIKSIQLGRKTGWNGDINKKYPHDTIIFKYNKKAEREYIQHIIFIVLFYAGLIAIFLVSLSYFSDFDKFFSSCFG